MDRRMITHTADRQTRTGGDSKCDGQTVISTSSGDEEQGSNWLGTDFYDLPFYAVLCKRGPSTQLNDDYEP